mmetsp:Transcript_32198/g.52966  ORF Transcript_32198/g.52966 Transcript_32198/m.52966 type:complete len:249 (-) Transcript_32198:25-771(-)
MCSRSIADPIGAGANASACMHPLTHTNPTKLPLRYIMRCPGRHKLHMLARSPTRHSHMLRPSHMTRPFPRPAALLGLVPAHPSCAIPPPRIRPVLSGAGRGTPKKGPVSLPCLIPGRSFLFLPNIMVCSPVNIDCPKSTWPSVFIRTIGSTGGSASNWCALGLRHQFQFCCAARSTISSPPILAPAGFGDGGLSLPGAEELLVIDLCEPLSAPFPLSLASSLRMRNCIPALLGASRHWLRSEQAGLPV